MPRNGNVQSGSDRVSPPAYQQKPVNRVSGVKQNAKKRTVLAEVGSTAK